MKKFLMNVILKVTYMVYKIICRTYNNKYYNIYSISNNAIFTPEFPGFVVLLNPYNISIGEKTVINRGTHINPGKAKVEIGKYCHVGQRLTIYAFNHRYESANKIPYDEQIICKDVLIKDFVWIGANVTILPGVKIEEGAIVGTGSVVTKNVPKYAVVGGNPAKILKFRNEEEFERLKKERAFF